MLKLRAALRNLEELAVEDVGVVLTSRGTSDAVKQQTKEADVHETASGKMTAPTVASGEKTVVAHERGA